MGITETPLGRRVALVILGSAFVASATALIAYNALVPSEAVTLAVGQVTPQDILAPRSLTYESEVLTASARKLASDAVRDVYDPPNPSVARQQMQLARQLLDAIEAVRIDTEASPQQQITALRTIDGLELTQEQAESFLSLSEAEWKNVDEQIMGVLERTMRDEIRESSLNLVYANLPNRISVTFDEATTALIAAVVAQLIEPNTFFNEERTREARKAAEATVTTERRNFVQGQIVVRAGSIVTDADMEALTQLQLLQPADRRAQIVLGALLAVLLFSAIGVIYLRRLHTALFHDVPSMVLIGMLLLAFLAGVRIFATTHDFRSYVYPIAAFSLIVVALTGTQVGIALTSALAGLTGLVAGGSLELAIMMAAGGTAGILSMSRTEKLNGYFRAGLIIGVANVMVILLFMLLQGNVDPIRVITTSTAGMLNGIFSAGIGVAGLYIVSNVLNMPTSLRLIELSQPNHPLLQRLLRDAPGTYQHSLQVANLVELAAERIGANALLVRVVALYHDIGKTQYPHFYVENQAQGVNPHDQLNDPQRSAEIIISHVTEGERLAHKYHLPDVFIDGILQHHGTTQVLYFYNKALKAVDCDESKVDKKKFTYPGPYPQNREMGILMLADSSESIVRAKRPQTRQEVEDIVRDVIDQRIKDGQLDDSKLTISDLKVISEIFVATLQGVFHPRIAYPPAATPETPAEPVPPSPVLTARTTQEIAP